MFLLYHGENKLIVNEMMMMFTLAVPAKDGDSFVLDMATTTVALGKVSLTYISSTNHIVGVIVPTQKCFCYIMARTS
jgi:hypothetical protein